MSLQKIQEDIQALYRLAGVPSIDPFLITTDEAKKYVPEGTDPGPQAFLLESEKEMRFAVHLPDDIRIRLETFGLRGASLSDFCSGVEEVSHFVYLVWSAENNRPVSLLDIEFQGEIDKYLLATAYHEDTDDLFGRLFERVSFLDQIDPARRSLYQEANHLGGKFCRFLGEVFDEGRAKREALAQLRSFYRMNTRTRLSQVTKL